MICTFTANFPLFTDTASAAKFTSLWSIKRERWINGPNLQDSGLKSFEYMESVCFIGVGKGEAYIMSTHDEFVSYNINDKQWTDGKAPSKTHVIRNFFVFYRSCVFHQDKDYNR